MIAQALVMSPMLRGQEYGALLNNATGLCSMDSATFSFLKIAIAQKLLEEKIPARLATTTFGTRCDRTHVHLNLIDFFK